MRGGWRICALIIGGFVVLSAAPLGALPPKAERIQEVRNLVAAIQDDVRALVLDFLEDLVLSLEELEDQLGLLAEAAEDLADQGGVYRPDEVRIILLQTKEIFENSFLFHLEQALDLLDGIDNDLTNLQGELDALEKDKLLSASGHKRATRALTQAQQVILKGKIRPPLTDLENLSDDGNDEACVTGPFGEPNMDADVQDCLNDAEGSLDAEDYEALLDQVRGAQSKLELMWERLVQVFRGTNLRRGPIAELLTQLKNIDRQLVSALKRQLRRTRLATVPSPPSILTPVELALFDLQGRQLADLHTNALGTIPLESALARLGLPHGVYIVVIREPDSAPVVRKVVLSR